MFGSETIWAWEASICDGLEQCICWFRDTLSSKLLKVGALNVEGYLTESRSRKYVWTVYASCMLSRLARASRCFSSWFILLELISVASGWPLGSSMGLGCVDSLLLESSARGWCLGSFPLLVEATDSGLFFLRSSSTNVATVSHKDSMFVVAPALRQTVLVESKLVLLIIRRSPLACYPYGILPPFCLRRMKIGNMQLQSARGPPLVLGLAPNNRLEGRHQTNCECVDTRLPVRGLSSWCL